MVTVRRRQVATGETVKDRQLVFGLFFFQAEDGIRDLTVTGVQTCALPICFSLRCFVPEAIPPTERTRVVRESHRGAYDRESIYKILDEGYVCHVGFAVDGDRKSVV